MSNTKVKGLLKGLRYISQIFDNEKEHEIQIGLPTDVKHVAHIGWDGPSVNSPSWMTEFSSPPPYSSGPLEQYGNGESKENDSTKWNTEDSSSSLRSSRPPASPGRDTCEKPRASRRHLSSGSPESPTKVKTERSKHRRPKSTSQQRDLSELAKPSRHIQEGNESPAHNMSGVPKKSRRKKSKDGGSTRSKSKTDTTESESNELNIFASSYSDPGLELARSESNSENNKLPPIKSPLKVFGDSESRYI